MAREELPDDLGHEEHRLRREAELLLGEKDFLLSQWLTVRRRRVLLVGAPVADVRPAGDQAGPFLFPLRCLDRHGDGRPVVPIDSLDVPGVAFESPLRVLAEGKGGVAFNADVVVVVEDDEPAQAQMSRE